MRKKEKKQYTKMFNPRKNLKNLVSTEHKSREIHPFSNREVIPIRSNRTGAEEKKTSKPAKEKPVPLKMDKVIACKGVRMSRPREKEIEFELNEKKKFNIPLKEILKQENEVLKKIYLKLNKTIIPVLKQAHEITNQISKNRREWGQEQPEKGVKKWNPEGKKGFSWNHFI